MNIKKLAASVTAAIASSGAQAAEPTRSSRSSRLSCWCTARLPIHRCTGQRLTILESNEIDQ